jgi:hypothetical protein
MIALIRRLALPVAVTSLVVNALMLVVSLAIWWLAAVRGWLDDVEFVSHVSMLALVFSAISGVAAAVAGVLALIPTDDLVELSDDAV